MSGRCRHQRWMFEWPRKGHRLYGDGEDAEQPLPLSAGAGSPQGARPFHGITPSGPRRIGHRAQIQAPGFVLWLPATDDRRPVKRSQLDLLEPPRWKSSTTTTSCCCRANAASTAAASATRRCSSAPRRFKLPVVPANMKTVVDEPITEFLAANGYFYVMHRFDIDNLAYAKQMRGKGLYVSISSGVKQADRDDDRPPGGRRRGRRLHHHRHRARPCRQRAAHDRATSRPSCRRPSSSPATWPRPKR